MSSSRIRALRGELNKPGIDCTPREQQLAQSLQAMEAKLEDSQRQASELRPLHQPVNTCIAGRSWL